MNHGLVREYFALATETTDPDVMTVERARDGREKQQKKDANQGRIEELDLIFSKDLKKTKTKKTLFEKRRVEKREKERKEETKREERRQKEKRKKDKREEEKEQKERQKERETKRTKNRGKRR